MTWRRVALYYALLAVALVYYWSSDPGRNPVMPSSENEIPLVDVALDRLTEVRVFANGEHVLLHQEGGRWQVVEPSDVQVPADLIGSFILTLVEARVREVIASSGSDREAASPWLLGVFRQTEGTCP